MKWTYLSNRRKQCLPRCRHIYIRFYMIVCLFVILHLIRKIFTLIEASPLLVKVCKFKPILGTHDHWETRILTRTDDAFYHIVLIILIPYLKHTFHTTGQTEYTNIWCHEKTYSITISWCFIQYHQWSKFEFRRVFLCQKS